MPFGKVWLHVYLDVSFDPAAPTCLSAQNVTIGPGLYCEDEGTGIAEIYLDNVELR